MSKRIEIQDLIKYVSGVGLDPELRAEIHRQRQIAGSPVQQWVAEFHAKLRNPLAVDWGAIASMPETSDGNEGEDQIEADEDVPPQRRPRVWRGTAKKPGTDVMPAHGSVEIPGGPMDDRQPEIDGITFSHNIELPPTMVDETIRLCLFIYRDLLAEFSPYSNLVRGSDADDPLADYRQPLERILCEDWNWVARRDNPAYKDESGVALAIATVLKERQSELPFPPEAIPVVAALLARIGLDDFCKLEDGS